MTEPNKPQQIVNAGRAMWVLWVLGSVLISSGAVIGLVQSQPGAIARLVLTIVTVAFLALLIRSVLSGRNWARITYAVIACVAVLALVLALVRQDHFSLVGSIAPIALIAAYVGVLWLLFHPTSNSWFRQQGRSST